MRRFLTLFLHLNIYTCFFFGINAQEIQLAIKAEQPITQGMKDSLQIKSLHKNLLSIEHEIDTLQLTLQRMGYIESELTKLNKENDSSYTAHFIFGRKYNEITIYYDPIDFNKTELKQISPKLTDNYFILPFEKIPIVMKKLTLLKTQEGNAFARLKLIDIHKTKDNNLNAYLTIDYGQKRTIDSIAIKGYEKFPKTYLKYYAGIKKGKDFDQKKLIKQNENLNSLGFANTTKPPEALFRKDSTTVYLYIEKQNNNLFDGILGFATNEESGKLEINGYLNLELNNNLNYGEQLLLNYKADGEEQISFRAKASLPYLFSSPLGLSGELNIFKRDSTFVTTKQQAKISYQINTSTTTYIGYQGFESSNLLDQAIAGTPIEDYTSEYLVSGVNYYKPQNSILFPTKTVFNLDTAIGSRKFESEKEDQVRLESNISNSFNLNYRNSIFIQNTTKALFSDNYLTNELFRFGGINSIRGFNENSIDASLFSVLNTEYRYLFNEGVYIHSIIDFAYFENETISLKQKLYSFGLGIGLQTKAGIFKFNVANGNTEDSDFSFSNTKIHISLTSKF